MRASDLSLDDPVSILMKAPPGFGKTLAALSFALDGPVHLAFWDKKNPIEMITYFTKKRFGDKAKTILDNITFERYGADNPHEYLNWLISQIDDCRYFAHVNDSVTTMTGSAVNWSLNFGNKGKIKTKIKDILPDFDEYKVETSLVVNCLDLCKKLPCHVIWTAHPVPSLKVEGTGSSMRVSKVNPIVSYGAKVAGIVPGSFTEIYHLFQQSEYNPAQGKGTKKYLCSLDGIGDEFAKSPLLGNSFKELEFTDKLFYEVWRDAIKVAMGELGEGGVERNEVVKSLTEAVKPTSNSAWKPSF